ncbi:hypothetical protein Sru01_51610 [Sphaerisporangium rufum]|uniref:Uncharacterized protein n=1 Tax=Sphaerisporangium rufum TaxID=1381558 RepID=A0A919R629_9ACTN|nr:hypothetical protein Sru01_51610 [Sphaerisporangium rufum]
MVPKPSASDAADGFTGGSFFCVVDGAEQAATATASNAADDRTAREVTRRILGGA